MDISERIFVRKTESNIITGSKEGTIKGGKKSCHREEGVQVQGVREAGRGAVHREGVAVVRQEGVAVRRTAAHTAVPIADHMGAVTRHLP